MSGWNKVAAGARLVLGAVVKQTAEDANIAAQRVTKHGLELGSRARQTAVTSQEIWSKTANTSDLNSHASRPNPYESQLRKQNQINPTNEENNHINGNVSSENMPNPYLLHSQQADETNSDTNENTESGERIEPLSLSSESQILSTDYSNQDQPRLKEGQAVPSTRIGRAAGFASLGIGLAFGTVSEFASRIVSSSSSSGAIVASNENADRLAATLCRMRGAALKMGQMLSIQDESLLPPALTRALKQVRQGADAMPKHQLLQQMNSELGPDWRTKFEDFDDRPFAAASIGQVHRATIRDDNDGGLKEVVVKVQYPGVANSIESDLRNLSMLVTLTGLSPKGLFIENVIRVGRDELKVECNYINEMANQRAMKELVANDKILQKNNFIVPNVIEELTTEQVITSEYSPGGTIDKVSHLDQDERNRIGRTILYLTMKELFDWRLMQTDPNWGNFLYDVGTRSTTLIDFGATREFAKDFVDGYLRIVWASANRDEKTLMEQSHRMKFLTGEENTVMLNAHKLSGFTVGEPFWTDEPFDFEKSKISTRMGEHTSVFLKHRLT